METNDGWGSCNKIIKNYRHATRHVQTVHEKLKPFECAVCKRCFSAKQVLMRHYEKIHVKEKQPFEIEPIHEGKQLEEIEIDDVVIDSLCKKCFSSKQEVMIHYAQVHEGK